MGALSMSALNTEKYKITHWWLYKGLNLGGLWKPSGGTDDITEKIGR